MHTQTHTHILVPSEDREPTGLKMDIGVSLVIVHRTECCHITPRTVQPDEALASAALMLYCLPDLTWIYKVGYIPEAWIKLIWSEFCQIHVKITAWIVETA